MQTISPGTICNYAIAAELIVAVERRRNYLLIQKRKRFDLRIWMSEPNIEEGACFFTYIHISK